LFCRDIFVYRLGNGASQASVPDPLEWYSGDTRKDGTFLQGLIKTMPYYGSSYNAPDDVTIGTLMNFSDTTYEGTSDGGYFLGAISGPTDKVDFINWFARDFLDPSLYVPVSEVFDDLNIQYRGNYTAWSTQSGGTIRGCFDNAGFAAFGSGFNIGNGNSATAFYLDWFKASYYYNGSRVNFDKAPV